MHDAASAVCGVYQPRRPQASPHFRLVSDHLHRLQRVYDERFAPSPCGERRPTNACCSASSIALRPNGISAWITASVTVPSSAGTAVCGEAGGWCATMFFRTVGIGGVSALECESWLGSTRQCGRTNRISTSLGIAPHLRGRRQKRIHYAFASKDQSLTGDDWISNHSPQNRSIQQSCGSMGFADSRYSA